MSRFTRSEFTAEHQPPPPPKRRKRSKSGRNPMRWILIAALVIAFSYVYIGGNYGWYHMWTLKQHKSQLEQEVSTLEARRLDLTSELEILRKDPEKDARLRLKMERSAREEYGMVHKDEMVYRFDSEQPEEEEQRTEDSER